MSVFRAWGLTMVLAVFAAPSGAQPPDSDAESPPREPPRTEAPEAEAEDAADDVFIPSEEIQADEEVTFPVDI